MRTHDVGDRIKKYINKVRNIYFMFTRKMTGLVSKPYILSYNSIVVNIDVIIIVLSNGLHP